MEISVVVTGSFMTNCWIVKDEMTGKALVVDPGFYSPELDKALESSGITELEYILITHGHTDHTCGAYYVRKKYGGRIVIGKKDAFLLENFIFLDSEKMYADAFTPCRADITVVDGDELSFGDSKIKVMHTPGHIPGEVCYIINDMLFSGDVLFKGSMGRTDFEGGDFFQMVISLKKLYMLEGEYRVFPGHGEKTTLEYERKTNSYLKAACRKNDT